MAMIEAVCVVHEVRPDAGRVGRTAIDKRPVPGRVDVQRLGLVGDRQMDLEHHGGPDQAVYAYAGEDASWWSGQLDRDLDPGRFGENLRTTGLDLTGAVIGEQWRAGPDGLLLEVTGPRIPCATFERWLGEKHWIKRFTEHGAPGAYLRVLQPGSIAAGDRVQVVNRPEHGVSIGNCFPQASPSAARRLLRAQQAGEVTLHPALRAASERALPRQAWQDEPTG
jgi:MOSC domain-containing protein YiiM